jgi:septum formation protein
MENLKIILASSSPRRKELLKKIGLSFKIKKSSVNEHFKVKLKPHLFAEYWAEKKAKSISKSNKNSLIIGADTIVVINGLILGKPADKQESIAMLKRLSGNVHEVITGVSIIYRKLDLIDTFHSTTKIFFNRCDEKSLKEYIKNEEPFDKAGSYGIQDSIAKYIKKIDGCYYNALGFPISKFHDRYNLILKSIKDANPN